MYTASMCAAPVDPAVMCTAPMYTAAVNTAPITAPLRLY